MRSHRIIAVLAMLAFTVSSAWAQRVRPGDSRWSDARNVKQSNVGASDVGGTVQVPESPVPVIVTPMQLNCIPCEDPCPNIDLEILTDIKAEIVDIKSEIVDVKAEITDIDIDVNDLDGFVADIKAEIVDIKAEIVDLEGDIAAVSAQVADVKAEVTDVKAEITDIKAEIADLKAEIQAIEVKLDMLPCEVIELLQPIIGNGELATTHPCFMPVDDPPPPPPVEEETCPDEAIGDEFAIHGSGHSFWMPGLAGSSRWVFDGPASYVEREDGTATLEGDIVLDTDSSLRMHAVVDFTGRVDPGDFDHPPSGSPKLELKSTAYSDQAGPVNPASWHYFLTTSGVLTGVGDLAGAVVTVDRMGPAYQVGVGASGKNTEFGSSGWLNWELTSEPNGSVTLGSSGHGDINIDIGECPEEEEEEQDPPIENDPPASHGACLSHAFEGLSPAEEVIDQFEGFTVSGTAPIVVFDTADPTCGDNDLRTPGQGIGNGIPRDHVLVVQELGSSCWPDDEGRGGVITFTFDQPTRVDWVGILDVEEGGAEIRALDGQGLLITKTSIAGLNDNSWQQVPVGAANVFILEVNFPKSGAVTEIVCDGSTFESLEGRSPARGSDRSSEKRRWFFGFGR